MTNSLLGENCENTLLVPVGGFLRIYFNPSTFLKEEEEEEEHILRFARVQNASGHLRREGGGTHPENVHLH